jgi:hypothetical protein
MRYRERVHHRKDPVTHAQQMLQTNPSSAAVGASTLVECVEACFDCAQSCVACADACLGEDDPKSLARCIRLNLDCADVCDATGRILSRQTAFEAQVARAALRACAEACRVCGDECEQHGQHGMEHCRVCAEACRRCEQACNDVLSALPA